MTIYLNIARDGIIKVTQDTALGNQKGDTDYLSKELNEGCTLEEVYAVVRRYGAAGWLSSNMP